MNNPLDRRKRQYMARIVCGRRFFLNIVDSIFRVIYKASGAANG